MSESPSLDGHHNKSWHTSADHLPQATQAPPKTMTIHFPDKAVHEALVTISQTIAAEGGKALLVGGCVRDTLLGLAPQDFDVEVYGIAPHKLCDILSRCCPIEFVGQSFGIVKVRGLPLDISIPLRTSATRKKGDPMDHLAFDAEITPQEAASRRDFTINALALDPLTYEIFDYFGGLQDLEDRILRHTSNAFREDPLRVLRAFQLIGRYELTPAAETIALAQDLRKEYGSIAIERIWGEWYKWAAFSTQPSLGLHWLQRTQWLEAYPELGKLQGCPQDSTWHPEGDVWTHTLLVTNEAAAIARRDALSLEDRATLVLAGLCHDLGKPAATTVTETGIHSRGHAQAQDTYRRLLQRLGTPTKFMKRVTALCLHHLTHLGFRGSFRHVRRLAVSLSSGGESIEMLGRLVEADVSGRAPLPKHMPETMRRIVSMAKELAITRHAPKPLLLGRHLLELGFHPGPHMGQTLKAAYEAQLEGVFQDLEGAKHWVMTQAELPDSTNIPRRQDS